MTQKQDKSSTSTQTAELDRKFQILLTLISLLKSARHKVKKTELEFLMINQTFNLVPYRHCVYWEWNSEMVSIAAVSGLIQIDPSGPYPLWLKKVIGHTIKNKLSGKNVDETGQNEFTLLFTVDSSDYEETERKEWSQWVSAHALMLVMKDRHGDVMGGLWIDREEPFADLEKAVLEDLGDGYAHALHRFIDAEANRRGASFKSVLSLSRSNTIRFFLAFLAVMVFPVRMSATVPAEVVAKNPIVVSVPMDGVIQKIEVFPGQPVRKGDVLVRMDNTILKNKVEMAVSDAQAAEMALAKTERESLSDKTKLADIAILKAQIQQKNVEQKFAEEMLEKSEIKADRDGIVIFSDVNALQGKPAHTGEQLMLLADPKDSELLLRVPVESMIEIDEKIPAKFYLNVMPIGSIEATYESIGYQASPDPDGLMTYKIRAKLTDVGEKPRIGSTGTGKVYGGRTIMAFNILRRPFITLRHKLGI